MYFAVFGILWFITFGCVLCWIGLRRKVLLMDGALAWGWMGLRRLYYRSPSFRVSISLLPPPNSPQASSELSLPAQSFSFSAQMSICRRPVSCRPKGSIQNHYTIQQQVGPIFGPSRAHRWARIIAVIIFDFDFNFECYHLSVITVILMITVMNTRIYFYYS